jgi:hypothetical protein
MVRIGGGLAVVALLLLGGAAPAEKRSAREALQPFNDLIGSWRATGTPEGTREEKQRGFWTESQTWGWQFKGNDAWLTLVIDKGKHFQRGELRYLPEQDAYRLTLTTLTRENLTFEGKRDDRRLTLTREDEKKKETQQIVLSLLHANRYLLRYEARPAGKALFVRSYQIGATKEGEPFAAGDGKPECIVSGGLGSMPVTYKGQTYYVCCSGCRDEFRENPEKYVREYEAKKKKK